MVDKNRLIKLKIGCIFLLLCRVLSACLSCLLVILLCISISMTVKSNASKSQVGFIYTSPQRATQLDAVYVRLINRATAARKVHEESGKMRQIGFIASLDFVWIPECDVGLAEGRWILMWAAEGLLDFITGVVFLSKCFHFMPHINIQ